MDKDWEELGEDVFMHCMMGFHLHEDGRGCYWHSRLQTWVFQVTPNTLDKKCLRDHEGARHG